MNTSERDERDRERERENIGLDYHMEFAYVQYTFNFNLINRTLYWRSIRAKIAINKQTYK